MAREKLTEIFTHWPLLRREVVGGDVTELPGNYGKDYVTLRFRNGSQFDLVGTTDSTRGGRRHGGLVDEVRDHNADDISEIILPLMNVSRRLPDNTVNLKEPNQQRIFATSAGIKNSFAYDALIDFFELQIIQPDKYITIGCDYRVPVLHGLLDKDYITTLKLSPAYNEESFAREYLSIWGGSSADSWLDFDKLTKYRKIKNPETHAKFREGVEEFYLLSVDVGRLHDQTTVNVFKVRNKNGAFYSSLVNLYVLGRTPETKPFDIQAIHIKRLIEAFKPEEVVIDTNGLGIGLGDEMIKQQIDENGVVYPAYGFFNDNDYKKVQPRNAKQILYGLKANGPLKSKIHSNAYAKITSGRVRFLIKEQEAKSTLMSTKQGQRMSVENRVRRLLPHEMTTRLMEEATNLRLKKGTTGSDIVLEQINSRVPDDKYMGFVYGLWRISEKEEELFTRKKRRNSLGGQRKLVFFNGG